MDSSTISSIVIAIIAALVSVLSLFFSYLTTRAAESRSARAKLDKQLKKYSQPLLIAAFDLQARLYELLEYPITDEALKRSEGEEDLKVFTCFRLARFLAAAWILRETTCFLSMQSTTKQNWWDYLSSRTLRTHRVTTTDEEQRNGVQRDAKDKVAPVTIEIDTSASKIRDLLYKIDDELDRRRDANGQNYGIFPGARLLVAERMVLRFDGKGAEGDDSKKEQEEVDEMKVKNWDAFRREWGTNFEEPCSWFLEWIAVYIDQRRRGVLEWKSRPGETTREDDHLRCLQHLLVDVVRYCDLRGLYDSAGAGEYRLCRRAYDCDCSQCGPNYTVGRRHESRKHDLEMKRISQEEV